MVFTSQSLESVIHGMTKGNQNFRKRLPVKQRAYDGVHGWAMAVKWDCDNGEQCCQQEPRSYSTDDLVSDIIFEDGRSGSHEPKTTGNLKNQFSKPHSHRIHKQ